MNNAPDEPWKNGGESANRFAAKHGGNPVWDPYIRRYLLPDGATMTLDGQGTAPPPTDPMRLLNTKRIYWQLLIERTEAHLDELAAVSRGEKLSVRWREELYGPKPGPKLSDAWDYLKKLLAKHQRKLADVQAELLRIHNATP